MIVDLDTPELRDAFASEVADVNRRRLRVIGPIMVVVHIAHTWLFWVATGEHTLNAATLWALGRLVVAHAVMVPITGSLTVLVFRSRRRFVARMMAPAVATLYLVHGALCTALALISTQSVSTYVGYCLGMGVILCISTRAAMIAYCIGLATLVISLAVIAVGTAAFLATMPTCVTITAVGAALASLLHAARRREFRQRVTIERQRDQLGALNSDLERRVQAQVGEIVAHAAEVEQLNAQLRAQVRARSSELSLALARLAQQRGDGATVLRGTLLGGRFAVGDVIGEGAMGVVYQGIDRATGARVAIKVVQATSTHTLDALRRFAHEAGTAAAITHPAVVRMLDVDIADDGLLFQVQELIDGEPLARMLGRAWSPGDAARVGAVLCEALAAAHAVGVVHRDVKPENIMLTSSAPGLKLLDFGIAKLYEAVHGTGEAMTRTGMIVGTPAYMAPEQVLGASEVGDRADVYAVGVVLFRLLSGRPPFEADSPREMMMNRLLDEPPSLRAFEPLVPESLAQLVERCLARAPEGRPPAADLARQLASWADAVGAPPLEGSARVQREVAATQPARWSDDMSTF
ncbi:MAG: serine/threonine protein kinase [Deltaproteobacteria bacterium]|nr:MAG: serine/threonine protein kinase [Deltaproteobacteria bacterium]